jgi:tRNA(Ile)-lysidine synthase
VAVSGGADSLALTLLAHRYAIDRGIAMTALTVDHRLRKGSTTEANDVHDLLARRGISHTILTWEHDVVPTTKIQEQARVNRYALLGKWCQENAVSFLLTAHHQGDQVETFFMRLAHRSGLKGLSSMRACTRTAFGSLLRPLLSIPKVRLIATLKAVGVTWCDDPSNENLKYERIRLRRALVDLDEQGILSVDAVGASIQKLQAVDDFLDESVSAFFDTFAVTSFSLSAFQAQHSILQRRILMYVLKALSTTYYMAPDALIDRVISEMMQPTFKGATLGGLYLRRAAGGVVHVQKEERSSRSGSL